jgi:D-alanine-D-alanine ligase
MNAVINRVGLTFDLRDTYLEAGYSEVETAEFDPVETIDGIENALQQRGYTVDRNGHVKQLAARLVAGDR